MLFAVVLSFSLAARLRDIAASVPYCGHPDEGTLSVVALRMLRERDTNPRRFNYPSLPVYLLAGGFWIGFHRVDARPEDAEATRRTDPYHLLNPAILAVPKWIFTGFSLAGLALLGALAMMSGNRQSLLWLTPAVAGVSNTYFLFSWWYLNVDIIGTCFVLASLTWLARVLSQLPRPLTHRDVAIGAVLAGLAVGSKYNLFPTLFPWFVAILVYDRKRWFSQFALLGSVSVLAFLVTTPFAIFDHATFIKNVLREMHHYANGHEGQPKSRWEVTGLELTEIWQSYGWLTGFAVIGMVDVVRKRAWPTLILFVYPVSFFLYMGMQRTFFARNTVSLMPFVAFAVALGMLAVLDAVRSRLALSIRWRSQPRTTVAIAVAVTAVVAALAVPWSDVRRTYRCNIESRTDARRYIEAHVRPGTELFVAAPLHMDVRRLARRYRLEVFDASKPKHPAGAGRQFRDAHPGAVAVIPRDRDAFFSALADGAAVLLRAGTRPAKDSATLSDPRLEVVRL